MHDGVVEARNRVLADNFFQTVFARGPRGAAEGGRRRPRAGALSERRHVGWPTRPQRLAPGDSRPDREDDLGQCGRDQRRPSTARSLGLADGDEVSIVRADVEIRLPVRVQPGQHEDVVAVALGYGREGTDRFAKIGPEWIESKETVEVGGVVGAHAGPLGSLVAGRVADRARVTLTGTAKEAGPGDDAGLGFHRRSRAPGARGRAQASHRSRDDDGRTLAAHAADGHGSSHHAGADLWKDDHGGSGAHWGMVIDLNRCTGCNACVAACQVENNVPVVGRDEVHEKSRDALDQDRPLLQRDPEDAEDVDVIQQPMMCQHCDNAPCETVCPVLATVHSEEGLNQQVYNRCVGTRYCANNCPYKVRRFNWFDYSHARIACRTWSSTPTSRCVRAGVMEKCSSVRAAHPGGEGRGETNRPADRGRRHPAGLRADLPDPGDQLRRRERPRPAGSEVSRAQADPLHFDVLGELNVKPSVGYLTGLEPTATATKRGIRNMAETSASPRRPWSLGDKSGAHRDQQRRLPRPMERRAGAAWWWAFLASFALADSGRGRGLLPDRHRHRDLGSQPHRRLGLRHHELRVLGRHRPRGDADLGDPVPDATEVAHVDEPRGRSDDDLRGDLRRTLSGHPHGASLAGALDVFPYPNGRGPLWVNFRSPCCGTSSRSGPTSRFRLVFWYVGLLPDLATLRDRHQGRIQAEGSTVCFRWAGPVRTAPGGATRPSTCCSPGLATPLVISVHTVVSFDFATSVTSPAGTPPSSRPTS